LDAELKGCGLRCAVPAQAAMKEADEDQSAKDA